MRYEKVLQFLTLISLTTDFYLNLTKKYESTFIVAGVDISSVIITCK